MKTYKYGDVHVMKQNRVITSRVVRKADFCICENKDADQLLLFCPLKFQDYTPNRYIVPMDLRAHFIPRISALLRRTKMHLNGMFLIGTEFLKIIVPL